MKALTPKQKRFCEEYIIDFNGTQAVIRAGYSKKTAAAIANELLSKPEITEYLDVLKLKLQEMTGISAQMVINELAKCGFANILEFVDERNTIKDISQVDRKYTAALAGVKTTTKTVHFNGGEETTVQTEIKLTDKISALEKLGKHLGIFEKDNTQKKTEIKSLSIEPVSKSKG